MKYAFLYLLLLSNSIWATGKNAENPEVFPLTGLKKFEVVTLVFPQDKIDQNSIYNSISESFRKFGQINISEHESMLSSLIRSDISYPICYFSISKTDDTIEVALDVLAEVEVLANKYKTSSPIWKKKLYAPVPQDNQGTDLAIGNLTQEIIQILADDFKKANNADVNQPSFHIRKFKEL